jgi:outer membrane protein TolC
MNYINKAIYSLFALCLLQVNGQELLTKQEVIEQALAHNFGIKVANNNVEVAKNNSSIYNSRYLPTITTNAGANYNRSNQDIVRQDGSGTSVSGAETKSYNASVSLNYVLFDGLGRKYNYKQLKETQDLTELQARETIENTYLQMFTVYFQIAQLYESTKNLKETLEVSKQRLERATYQYEYGQNTKLEVLNAEVDVNNDSINLINAQQQFANAKRDLNLIIGGTTVDYIVETDIDFIQMFSLSELLQKALDNNVVLRQNEKNILIGEYGLKANKATYLPTIGLTSSYGWNKNINPPTSFLAEISSNGLNAGLNLSWDLFDGGTTKTRVANAKIALENQKILKEQQEQTVETNLTNAWEDYNNRLFIYRSQEQNVLTATDNFSRTDERYKLGQVSSIEFRQAQINLLNAQTNLNTAKFNAKLKELELLQLAGELLNVDF